VPDTTTVPFAIEVAEFVDTKLDGNVGVLAAVSATALAKVVADDQTPETDTDHLDFSERSESLHVPESLEQAFWQILP
jgi:hypothetical protein